MSTQKILRIPSGRTCQKSNIFLDVHTAIVSAMSLACDDSRVRQQIRAVRWPGHCCL